MILRDALKLLSRHTFVVGLSLPVSDRGAAIAFVVL